MYSFPNLERDLHFLITNFSSLEFPFDNSFVGSICWLIIFPQLFTHTVTISTRSFGIFCLRYLDHSNIWAFPCGSAGKESAWNAGDLGLTPGLGRSPGEGKVYPLQYSGLENFMHCIVMGWQRVGYDWVTLTLTRDLPQTEGHLQTENKEMRENIPYKLKSKETWSSNMCIRQNRV